MARDYFPAGKKSAQKFRHEGRASKGGGGGKRQRTVLGEGAGDGGGAAVRDFNGRKILEVRRNKLERT